ncbi:hypothetical protein ACH35V_30630 [Actinomadura sp. 1N219]|uniref:hypothetical protein n=1 Tax=Actinomadura sp. 1N219 TaxID=3375152 RepID=UPI0037A72306
MANRKSRLIITAVAMAAFTTTAAAPGTAHAGPVPRGGGLPPGVVKLAPSATCPKAMLCLYRFFRHKGPAYGIFARYRVALKDLPMDGGTAANSISSWQNNTHATAVLTDERTGHTQRLAPGQRLEDLPPHDDIIDHVDWA